MAEPVLDALPVSRRQCCSLRGFGGRDELQMGIAAAVVVLLPPGANAAGYTTFDLPDAGTGKYQGTFARSIDTGGDTTGFYADGASAYHGLVRLADGTVSQFDMPGADVTEPKAINDAGPV